MSDGHIRTSIFVWDRLRMILSRQNQSLAGRFGDFSKQKLYKMREKVWSAEIFGGNEFLSHFVNLKKLTLAVSSKNSAMESRALLTS
jgi:hypothetical protein